MTKKVETLLIKKYKDFYNTPALDMFDQDNDSLDSLHTEVELLGGYIAGFIDTYIKTKKINWTSEDLKNKINSLKQKIKNIDLKKVKEKFLFNKYKEYINKILELIDLMLKISKEDV